MNAMKFKIKWKRPLRATVVEKDPKEKELHTACNLMDSEL